MKKQRPNQLKPWISFITVLLCVSSQVCVSSQARGDIPPGLSMAQGAPLSQQPFWRSKPAVMRKIKEERAIVVSVKRENIKIAGDDQIRFTMVGGGMVSRPKDFCFVVSQEFEKLKDISTHFRTVDYDAANHQLFLVTEALGYQARMMLKILPVSEDWRSELKWEVIWGHFKGMTGVIGYEKSTAEQTEVSIQAKYEAKELPLPRILMGFALEVITQKIAEKMRTFIEAQPALALEKTLDVRQTGEGAGRITNIKLPPGFSISFFAQDVPGARQMALSPSGTLFVGSRIGTVYAIEGAVPAAAEGKSPPAAKIIAKDLVSANGVAVHDGALYVAEISRILRYDQIDKQLAKPPQPVVVRADYPTDQHHGWKFIAIGPDGWLYVPVGMPCNVCKEEDAIYGTITRLSLDGKKRELFSTGLRNTVGFDWSPKTKELWFTDHGADNMGDDIPSDELNRAPKAGLHFGFPYCHEGNIKDSKFGKKADCSEKGPYRQPEQKFGAHVAALGMRFYKGTAFPPEFQNQIYVAQHGSWNRSKKVGYRIVRVPVDGAKSQKPEVFAEGWLQGEQPWGRPVDVQPLPDGSLLVSDDLSGVIYRITYKAPK